MKTTVGTVGQLWREVFIVFALTTNWEGVLLAVVTGLIILCTMISLILKEMFRRR